MRKIYIVDMSSIVHRCYHALPEIRRGGGAIHAYLGYKQKIEEIIKIAGKENIAIAVDSESSSLTRKEIWPQYKSNRPPRPADLTEQLDLSESYSRELGLIVYSRRGYEADDVIASIVTRTSSPCVIVSGDKDLCALVTHRCELMDPSSLVLTDYAGVIKKFGVRPDQIEDYLALRGDAADGIPGVTSVGPKTAADLLSRFETIDGIYENIDKIAKPLIKRHLIVERSNLIIFRKLTGLVRDLDLEES